VSGWHHHGEYETSSHIVSGTLRLEFGPGGQQVLDARAGDFGYVPPGVVHREGNPGDDAVIMVMTRAGHGPAVIEVDGPDPRSRGAQPPG